MSMAEDDGHDIGMDEKDFWDLTDEVGYWTDNRNVDIKMSDMEVSHIKNCIRLLKQWLSEMPDPYAWGEPEGDAAQDAFNSEVRQNEMTAELFNDKIEQFEEELERRSTFNNKELF